MEIPFKSGIPPLGERASLDPFGDGLTEDGITNLTHFREVRIVTSWELTVEGAGVDTSRTARIASDHLPVWVENSVQHEHRTERVETFEPA